jgi:glutaredoxin
MMAREIFLYALSTCPWCRKAKQWFTDNEVPFDYVDVDQLPPGEQEKAGEKAFELSGGRRYPVIVIDGEVIVGYKPDRFAELTGSGGA